MNNIDYSDFLPVYGSYIKLPKNTMLWRCYDTNFATIQDRPTFYGRRETAKLYSKDDDEEKNCSIFTNRKQLKLIDIRYMRVILKEIFHNRLNTKDTIDHIKNTSFALGLISFKLQIEFFNDYIDIEMIKNKTNKTDEEINFLKGYNNMIYYFDHYNKLELNEKPNILDLFEFNDIRIGFTPIDVKVVILLKEIFKNYCDGFIAPKMFSPFHMNYINEEILIFDPINKIIKTDIPFNDFENMPIIQKLNDINMKLFKNISFMHNRINESQVVILEKKKKKGGARKDNLKYIEDKNKYMYNLSIKEYNNLIERAALFNDTLHIVNLIPSEHKKHCNIKLKDI